MENNNTQNEEAEIVKVSAVPLILFILIPICIGISIFLTKLSLNFF